MIFMKKIFLIALIFWCASSLHYTQDVNIIPYLQAIENGEAEKVESQLPELKRKHPESPSLIFLEAVLTKDGEQALLRYELLLNRFPQSKYADAALFRIYSYYYALGDYRKAGESVEKLKNNYPYSPYTSIAKKYLPTGDQPVIQRTTPQTQQRIEEKEIAQTVPVNYRYTIQAGAFTNPANAENLKTELLRKGYTTEIKEKVVGGTVFEIVIVGKFTTEGEAKSFLQKVNRELNLDGRVVPIE